MKKILSLLVVTLVSASVLMGCKKAEEPAPEPAPAPTNAAPTNP